MQVSMSRDIVKLFKGVVRADFALSNRSTHLMLNECQGPFLSQRRLEGSAEIWFYSRLLNKRTPLNKHTPWNIFQN